MIHRFAGEERKCLFSPICPILKVKLMDTTALLNHFHVKLARSIHCGAAHASV